MQTYKGDIRDKLFLQALGMKLPKLVSVLMLYMEGTVLVLSCLASFYAGYIIRKFKNLDMIHTIITFLSKINDCIIA